MTEVRHENLNQFIGACIELNNISIVTSFAFRGSLKVRLSTIFNTLIYSQ